MHVYQLRASSFAMQELDWYFNRSASEMGVCSNFEQLKNLALSGGGQPGGRHGHALSEQRAEAAARQSRVIAALRRLSAGTVRILELCYLPHRLDQGLVGAFGEASAVAVHTSSATAFYRLDSGKVRVHENSLVSWLVAAILRADPRVETIRQEAQNCVLTAHLAFERQMSPETVAA